MSYSEIKIYGGADVNYLNVSSKSYTSSQIEDILANGLCLPQWEQDSLMVATYQKTINATPLSIDQESIIGYQVYRLDTNTNIMSFVTATSQGTVEDYNVKGNVNYQYYIFPIIKDNNSNSLGSPLVTNDISPLWEMCTIVGLLETDNDNEYIVDPDNIWKLQLNLERENYELNMDKVFTDGFDRFPKRTQGEKKYITSGLNSIIGTLTCDESAVDFTASDVEKWEDFCKSPNLKLFNDMKGRILLIDIKSASTGYFVKNQNSPIVTNISFVQMADSKDISIHNLVDDIQET